MVRLCSQNISRVGRKNVRLAVTSGRLFRCRTFTLRCVFWFFTWSLRLLALAPQLRVNYCQLLESRGNTSWTQSTALSCGTWGWRGVSSHREMSVLSFFFFFLVAGVLDYFGHRSIPKNKLCSSHSAPYFPVLDWRWVILLDFVWVFWLWFI